ncbi:unnamed protein product [Cylindrotheca closterium]|uniref:Uncharacterized protein n=1 Tax=Cylindrotheca closterium TaxID=2856 RepID=A0AAD2FPF6_9STRA|nr:unnamed protein product [Cylindrotheca closterium]
MDPGPKSRICKEEQEELISAVSDNTDESSSPSAFECSHSPRSKEGIIVGKSVDITTLTSEPPANGKQYEKYAWKDLPPKVQEAATCLGYTEQLWNENQQDPEKDKYWEELNVHEKEAAKILGYDEVHWDFGDKQVEPADYDDMYWNQLPKHIRKAYRVLGYRKTGWNEDESPASFDKDWFELTEAEQKAATIVGYTAETWDDDPDDMQEEGIKEGAIYFVKGSCYVLLDCLSMSSFFGIINALFSLGREYLDDNALGVLKILTGLAIMQLSGQMHKWLEDEEEEAATRQRGQNSTAQPTLFRSFLNLFSWWSIFAGVDHFLDAFENDVLYFYSDSSWYLKLCEEPDNATQCVLNATSGNNMTTELLLNATAGNITMHSPLVARLLNYTDRIEEFMIDCACEILDDDQERLGPVYLWTVFIGSAVTLWYAFDDNFLTGCDPD